ncbi:hypothetical protein D3OALGB2SA_4907 [Olavius algarvensis associated proteobacterium Delta 3]|nr:hypothetical protein D3OALGB2SA_4907 [Olavius algarvensis associated proteobacterium Delta 3]
MAEVLPFKGIYYNPSKIRDMAEVVMPPFDVISPKEQDDAYRLHPHNMIRLELSRKTRSDSDRDNAHIRAARAYTDWVSENILLQDDVPAFYVATTEFAIDETRFARVGLIGRIRLEPFEKGVVRPHEKTFSRVRADRLELMKVCRTNFSPIYALYPDARGSLRERLDTSLGNKKADTDFVDRNGHRHRLWRLSDPTIQRSLSEEFRQRIIYIADGHHRYETALAYRRWLRKNDPSFSETHPANYVMMHLTAMEDPGMVILPAHRLLKEVPAEHRERLLEKAPEFFQVERIPFGDNGGAASCRQLVSRMGIAGTGTRIGICMKDRREFFMLTLKPDVMAQRYQKELSDTLRDIDVTVLTRLIFMDILGFDNARLDNEKLIGYASTARKAVEEVGSGEYDITFILNSTRIDQVRRVADNGLIMPRKATYFYPKVIAGLVMNSLDPAFVG